MLHIDRQRRAEQFLLLNQSKYSEQREILTPANVSFGPFV
jgi:hypothetical protein